MRSGAIARSIYRLDPLFQTAELTISAGGAGKGRRVLHPEAAGSLRNATQGATWMFSANGSPAYQTGCSTIVLDRRS
jgi:hypothetical protein